VLGLLFHSAIKERLFNPCTIAIALAVGGILMIVLERVLPSHDEGGVDAIGWKRALGIGFSNAWRWCRARRVRWRRSWAGG
jgi:undecaprenyl-diphosphatase